MPRRFCVNTKGLRPDEKKELATSLNKFVETKKAEFEERRQNSKKEDSKE